MRVKQQYKLPNNAFAVLLALLCHSSRFTNFMSAVSAEYEVTGCEVGTGVTKWCQLEQLCHFVLEHSDKPLHRAS
jgi:hypothetical protein